MIVWSHAGLGGDYFVIGKALFNKLIERETNLWFGGWKKHFVGNYQGNSPSGGFYDTCSG